MNALTGVVQTTIIYAAPIVLTATGSIFCERSGVFNIALEGLMTIGAFVGAIAALGLNSPWVACLLAIIAGTVFSLPHAIASIRYKADQIISGVALNFLASGLAVFLTKMMFGGSAQTDTVNAVFNLWSIPGLSKIPVIGPMFFHSYPTSYIAIILVVVAWFVLYKTPFGLRIRSVGENPAAADTVGIPVYRMRYYGVMISGAFAGLGGAVFSLTTTSNFSFTTISGQGFIALAAVIFGKWRPVPVMLAALFFGLGQSLSSLSQVLGLAKYIPVNFIQMLPYVLTILVLAGFVGNAIPPKAGGVPYEKGAR